VNQRLTRYRAAQEDVATLSLSVATRPSFAGEDAQWLTTVRDAVLFIELRNS
jgi:hypothetical protein